MQWEFLLNMIGEVAFGAGMALWLTEWPAQSLGSDKRRRCWHVIVVLLLLSFGINIVLPTPSYP